MPLVEKPSDRTVEFPEPFALGAGFFSWPEPKSEAGRRLRKEAYAVASLLSEKDDFLVWLVAFGNGQARVEDVLLKGRGERNPFRPCFGRLRKTLVDAGARDEVVGAYDRRLEDEYLQVMRGDLKEYARKPNGLMSFLTDVRGDTAEFEVAKRVLGRAFPDPQACRLAANAVSAIALEGDDDARLWAKGLFEGGLGSASDAIASESMVGLVHVTLRMGAQEILGMRRRVQGIVEAAGLDPRQTIGRWYMSENPHVAVGLCASTVDRLRMMRPEAPKRLFDEYGIRYFGRNTPATLARQYDELGETGKPYVLQLSSGSDFKGAFYQDRDLYGRMQADLGGDVLYRAAEFDGRFSIARRLLGIKRTHPLLDTLIIQAHGQNAEDDPHSDGGISLTYGAGDGDLKASQLSGPGVSRLVQALKPRMVILSSCWAGQREGFAQRLSEKGVKVMAPEKSAYMRDVRVERRGGLPEFRVTFEDDLGEVKAMVWEDGRLVGRHTGKRQVYVYR